MQERFGRFARAVEHVAGSPWAFAFGVLTIVVWAAFGPYFDWSDTHQLIINTGTTIVTFLMVFLIQSTQSRDTAAIHLKLDELIRSNKAARNIVIASDDMDQAHLDAMRSEVREAAKE